MEGEQRTKISVVISTYRRVKELRTAIDSLKRATRKPDEILVVASEGDRETEKLLRQMTGIRHFTVAADSVLLKENLGIREAQGDIVCFTDDDATVHRNWLRRIEEVFNARDEIGAVGGPCIPVIDGKVTKELTPRVPYITFYGKVGGGSVKIPHEAGYAAHLRGCNMCFRRDVLVYADENLKGDGSRFETDMCLWVSRRGYKIWYDPRIYVLHHLAPRQAAGRPVDPKSTYWFNFNNTYVLLKHFSRLRRLVFLLYTFLVGDYMSKGVLYLLGKALRRRDPAVVLEILPTYAGKLHAIRELLAAEISSKKP